MQSIAPTTQPHAHSLTMWRNPKLYRLATHSYVCQAMTGQLLFGGEKQKRSFLIVYVK